MLDADDRCQPFVFVSSIRVPPVCISDSTNAPSRRDTPSSFATEEFFPELAHCLTSKRRRLLLQRRSRDMELRQITAPQRGSRVLRDQTHESGDLTPPAKAPEPPANA